MHTLSPITTYALQITLAAGLAYITLELAKKWRAAAPISGAWSIFFNGIFSMLFLILILPVSMICSVDSLGAWVLTMAAAAGIHGTARSWSWSKQPREAFIGSNGLEYFRDTNTLTRPAAEQMDLETGEKMFHYPAGAKGRS